MAWHIIHAGLWQVRWGPNYLNISIIIIYMKYHLHTRTTKYEEVYINTLMNYIPNS